MPWQKTESAILTGPARAGDRVKSNRRGTPRSFGGVCISRPRKVIALVGAELERRQARNAKVPYWECQYMLDRKLS